MINTLKKYIHKGTAYEPHIDSAVALVFGEERAYLIDKGRDSDTMLCYTFDILTTQIRKKEQARFLQLLYAIPVTVEKADTVMIWNDKNGLNCGIYDSDCRQAGYSWIELKDGTGIKGLTNSMTIATDEEKISYGGY